MQWFCFNEAGGTKPPEDHHVCQLCESPRGFNEAGGTKPPEGAKRGLEFNIELELQ